jgi:Pyruvate/2-oxoacid:ferredoxin oxidoreductase delta subunit
MTARAQISRRELFSRLFRFRRENRPEPSAAPPATMAEGSKVAIIQGRFCLAYRNSFCTVCSERCPEPGAIQVENGFPRVVADLCTGCGICHEVCPAPRNAVLMMRRKVQD